MERKIDIFEKAIMDIDASICKNIAILANTERGLLSQNILDKLRNLVEHISLKIFSLNHDAKDDYQSIELANDYISSKGELAFLNRFHKFLQISSSHYTEDEDGAIRLMLKYNIFLIKTKEYVYKKLGLEILSNIDDFPLNLDTQFSEYYEKIANQIEKVIIKTGVAATGDKFYIQKVKPFFINRKIYYEVTLSEANDRASKFDRFIAYTQIDLLSNYAMKLSFKSLSVKILERNIPIKIIDNYSVAIRNCELKNFGYILGVQAYNYTGTKEYLEIMKYLTCEKLNLVEVIDLKNEYYNELKERIRSQSNLQVMHIFDLFDRCRTLVFENKPGANIIKYVLYIMKNKVIKAQFRKKGPCFKLSDLFLDFGCIPFDSMPFVFSLKSHTPKLSSVFDCINCIDREHELLARKIISNTESKSKLYTDIKELGVFRNIDKLVIDYNKKLYEKHRPMNELARDGNNIYIKHYESDTLEIIKKLLEFTQGGIKGYKNSIETWLDNDPSCPVDSKEKKDVILSLFECTRLAIIYGSAGTGKTTLIGNLSSFFNDKQKLYLSQTNPAVENLRRKVKTSNSDYMTVTKLIGNKDLLSCDILFIDECSTLSNEDMKTILEKISTKLIILVGDIYQIESISFGNWFNLAKYVVPTSSIHELIETRRTDKQELLDLWVKVRNIDMDIIEYIVKKNFSKILDKSVFEKKYEDEIILCLNYDGLYGINNINRYLQNDNSNTAVEWGIWTYKIGDPIIFNESNRFAPLMYNNLKGNILAIEKDLEKIKFDIEIEIALNEMDVEDYGIELKESIHKGKSVISFYTYKTLDSDEDDDLNASNVIPFQIAYAVSIHKAQGLEYDSVKVIITNEIEEMISHNIFYTAITRAKNELNIYWTPETENKVINGLEHLFNKKDAYILTKKFKLPIRGMDN